MRIRKFRYFSCDFETTVYNGQDFTEVWAGAAVELFTEDVHIFRSIGETFSFLEEHLKSSNVVAYFHNLKFDGSFWLPYFIQLRNFRVALKSDRTGEYFDISKANSSDDLLDVHWVETKNMENETFKYNISDRGSWYTIILKINGHILEIRDSLKLLPFSVEEIGRSFGTKHKKLSMEYEGIRYAGCEITLEEKEYIANDVLVVKEALEIMFADGHDKLTIGACCLAEYKSLISKYDSYRGETWNTLFPDMESFKLNKEVFGYENADRYIRKSYRGGWCYLVKGEEGKVFNNGVTFDVNSLYPSVMHSESGSRYPIGKPHFWTGNFIPEVALTDNRYYFIRIRTRFYIKKNYLPVIQIKDNALYKSNEWLETSDVYAKNTVTGEYEHWDFLTNKDGGLEPCKVTLTLTMTDFQLIREHYNLIEMEILDGCWFESKIGIFDDYINKYAEIKKTSKGAKRQEAKLFLNNLYGKMASSSDSSFKVAYERVDGSLGFYGVDEHEKDTGFIPVGSAITSYARNFTIRAAQKNFYGDGKRGFKYADTDSIHVDLPPEEIKGVKVHPVDFCCWCAEARWDKAIFVRQKTYIEHVTEEDLIETANGFKGEEPKNGPYYNIKCAGMQNKPKKLFNYSLTACEGVNSEELTEVEKEFLFDENGDPIIRTLEDFKIGLQVPGRLAPKRIKGGVVLVNDLYTMRSK